EGVYAVYSALVDSDLAFTPAAGSSGETVEGTQGSIHGLLASPARDPRRSAWESYADGHSSVRNTLAAAYMTAMKQDAFSSRAPRHESTRARALLPSDSPV